MLSSSYTSRAQRGLHRVVTHKSCTARFDHGCNPDKDTVFVVRDVIQHSCRAVVAFVVGIDLDQL